MSGRGGGRRGRGGIGGGGGRGPGGGRSSGGVAGRGQSLTPAARPMGDAPISFGSISHFPALGSSAGSGSPRPVGSFAAAAGPSRPVVGSSLGTSGSVVGSSSGTPGPVVGSSSGTSGPVVGSGTSGSVVGSSSGTSGSAASAPNPIRELEEKVQTMALAPRHLPKRPGYGVEGKKTFVKANHFLVKIADSGVHQYDVSITPEVKPKNVKRQIMKQVEANYKTSHLGNKMIAFDGEKIVYTAGALPFTSMEFVVILTDMGKEREYKVAIKFAARVNVSHLGMYYEGRTNDFPQSVIQALDIVLREIPSNNPRYVPVGRSFFDVMDRGDLGDGVEYWKGYYQSLRPTRNGLSLNIDVSATAFYKDVIVSEFVRSYLNLSNRDLQRVLSDQERIKAKKVLRNVRVEVTHTQADQKGNRRRYKITDLTTLPLGDLSFSRNGVETTIVRYFYETYNYRVQHVAWPALVSGNPQKPIHLPMEVCKIVVGQKYPKKLNERQVTKLLDASCQRPQVRQAGINKIVDDSKFEKEPLLKQFGFDISTQLTSIEARVLDPPKIKYHGSIAHPQCGQWNMINKKLVNGGRVDKWLCVNFSREVRFPENIYKPLIDMCRDKGMVFNPEPAFDLVYNYHVSRIKEILHDLREQCKAKSMRPQLLIIILPDISGQYGTIKRICETDLGVASQCLNPRKASRLSGQYFENVALKINVKVGGRNSVLQQAVQRNIPLLTDRLTIIFGADVTHPQAGEDAAPSIASVVASMDWPEVTKYRSLVSAQPHRQEIIQDLYKEHTSNGIVTAEGMIRDHIETFGNANRGDLPERIIFYRDGVSEGQFGEVLLNEVDAIRRACLSLKEKYIPKVTFVVVQKRHHTRLFPHGDRGTTDRSGNIVPGTVVDTNICHPSEFDFYLCSHAGIKGTSRPTHYHVLYDENNCKADDLQRLTYHLCYTYARCTRAVSIVPPAYYAHLAAYRARYYVEGLYSDSGSQNRAVAREQEIQPAPLPAIKGTVKESMFYC